MNAMSNSSKIFVAHQTGTHSVQTHWKKNRRGRESQILRCSVGMPDCASVYVWCASHVKTAGIQPTPYFTRISTPSSPPTPPCKCNFLTMWRTRTRQKMKAAYKFWRTSVINIPTKNNIRHPLVLTWYHTWQRHGYYTCINWESGRAVTLTQPGLRCLSTCMDSVWFVAGLALWNSVDASPGKGHQVAHHKNASRQSSQLQNMRRIQFSTALCL